MVTLRCCVKALTPSNIFEALLWFIFVGLATLEWFRFRAEPTFTTVELESVDLPAFTVCPGSRSNSSMTRRLFSQYGGHLWNNVNKTRYQNVTFRQMFVDHSLSIGKMLGRRRIKDVNSSQYQDVVYRTRRGHWKRTFFSSGTCYTYRPRGRQDNKAVPFRGPTLRLHAYPEFTQKMTNITHEILFHGAEISYNDFRFFSGKDIPRAIVRSGEAIQINVKVNRYRSPNLRRSPCNDTPGYTVSGCLSLCWYRRETTRLGCAMPWMTINAKPCVFPMKHTIFVASSREKLRNCRCLQSCLNDRLDITVGESPLSRRDGRTFFNIQFQYLADTRITSLSYNGQQLMSNIGGYVGLLLGTSILSLIVRGMSAAKDLYQQRQ